MLAFVETRGGDVLLVDYTGGALHRLEVRPPATEPVGPFPRKLSETGIYVDTAALEVHPGVVPYDVISPLWSDGATKDRHIALPGDASIEFDEGGPWRFPEGAALVKTFRLPDPDDTTRLRPIETRVMLIQQNEWVGYSYRWNEAATDAELVDRAGLDVAYEVADLEAAGGRRTQNWRFPSRTECMVCHARAAGFVLGVNTMQANRPDSPALPGIPQLEALGRLGVVKFKSGDVWSDAPTKPVAEMKRLTDPADESAPLETRARSYLHANCANCHVWAGGGNSAIDLRAEIKLDEARLIDTRPIHDTFGLPEPRLVAPGAPERSVLLHRLRTRGRGQMPPLASSLVDVHGTALLETWIRTVEPAKRESNPAGSEAP
jgi:uncharacterized repeat protein (TIGR03806 family)